MKAIENPLAPFRAYLNQIAGGYVPTHEAEEVERLANATLKADLADAVALLQTLADVAAEASAERQSYDFAYRAQAAADKALAFLTRIGGAK